ncbi:MAG TPA: 30S ribosomal protein S6 [Syntrophales bacterium]|nr:30S ribosomal protein S6 [Syntrophales bacterium]HPQ44769.1 30S ribosomal protein S6 [Syntrophales bacterium]
MLRRYETIFIMRGDLQSDEIGSLIDRYAGIITNMDGKTVKVENWGKRRLAYPIEKRKEGVYVRIDFAATYKVVSELERNFKIDDNVIRFQTVKLSDKVDLEEIEREIENARKKEEDQRKEALKREEELKEKEPVSETTAEETETPEETDGKDSETGNEDVAQDSAPIETEEEKGEEA